ncbi:UNVERIFIED_CONTAM: hypothetical protein Sradi_4364000 [Sesamum radiatum]|uniref:RNase H type-1 domain-containing protein n=1 Tax=Sesamum radiatum TaxID=300843 RepID=A0AAW2NQV2_SESRA
MASVKRLLWSFEHIHGELNVVDLVRLPAVWTTPPNCVKINFDGVVYWEVVALGIGVVAKSHTRECVGWFSLRWMRRGKAELAEALATRQKVSCLIRGGT